MPIKIFILGLRGVPKVQGGIETHVENLAPLLVSKSCDVTILSRQGYQPALVGDLYKGVKIKNLWSPNSRKLEAIIHPFIGVMYAAIKRPDILHIHAIGPSIMVPIARLLGLRVVMTHHGPDYDRAKWGSFAKWTLRTGERFGVKYSNKVIVISEVIQSLIQSKHGVSSVLIPNGVTFPEKMSTTDALEQYGLNKQKYVLMVSRLVPEKNHFDLIKAFKASNLQGWKLVLVGNSDHPDEYSSSVFESATNSSGNVVATGFLSGQPLQELLTNAGMFVLPSSHEGLPIALLEALSYGLPVIASDIPATLEVGLDSKHYYSVGNIQELVFRLEEFAAQDLDVENRRKIQSWTLKKFDWDLIADETLDLYKLLVK
jgi:glycosyltransferase involved in cell wall biosynthesis